MRFGNVSFQMLLRDMRAIGAERSRLQAKIFGGACVLARVVREGNLGLGRQNIQLARELLAAAAIPLVAEDVGGRRGRKLVVHTDTGDAWVKLL